MTGLVLSSFEQRIADDGCIGYCDSASPWTAARRFANIEDLQVTNGVLRRNELRGADETRLFTRAFICRPAMS